MGARQALNVCYAFLVDGLDQKQRDELNTRLYGWDEVNTRGDAMLRRPVNDNDGGGGEG